MKTTAVAAMAGVGRVPTARSADDKKPNFICLMIDDLGYMDLGCYGATWYETPRMDSIAEKGMRFTQGYVSAVCSPTRSSFLVGQCPARTGVHDWIGGWQAKLGVKPKQEFIVPDPGRLSDDKDYTIANALQAAGYKTGHVGKWHVGQWGNKLGFGKKRGSGYGNPPKDDYKLVMNDSKLTCDMIKGFKDGPFFINVNYEAMHSGIKCSPELKAKYEAKTEGKGEYRTNPEYAGLLEYLDNGVGMILDTIEECGIAENTVVMLIGDNGGNVKYTSQHPWRSGKGTGYEGGIRVPMIINAPGVTKPGSTCDAMVTIEDYFPTMLELAGLPLMPDKHIDGLSMMPLLEGATGGSPAPAPAPEPAVDAHAMRTWTSSSGSKVDAQMLSHEGGFVTLKSESGKMFKIGLAALSAQDREFVKNTQAAPKKNAPTDGVASAIPAEFANRTLYWHYPHYHKMSQYGIIRKGDYKLLEFFRLDRSKDRHEMYNLKEDPYEKNDIFEKEKDKAEELIADLHAWQKRINAPFGKPNPDYNGAGGGGGDEDMDGD